MDATHVQSFSNCLMPRLYHLYCTLLKSGAIEKIKQIEKVHLYACKLFINVPTVTPNDMIYGELGRYPLYIEAAAKCIQYWFPCAKAACFTVLKDGLPTAVNFTREGAWKLGKPMSSLYCANVAMALFGGVGDEKLFLRDFKERLRQNFTQDWFSHLSQSTRFEMYHCFKSVIGREEYLDPNQSEYLQDCPRPI